MFGKEMFAGPSRDNVPGWTLIKWPCLPPPNPATPGSGVLGLTGLPSRSLLGTWGRAGVLPETQGPAVNTPGFLLLCFCDLNCCHPMDSELQAALNTPGLPSALRVSLCFL